MNKELEKRVNDLETRLVHRFNTMLKQMQAKERLENQRIEKLIDMNIDLALQKISNKIETFLKAVDKKKL